MKMKLLRLSLLAVLAMIPLGLNAFNVNGISLGRAAESALDANPLTTESLNGLALRGVGPVRTSGRVAAIAMDPRDSGTWYVAVAAGGLWKTTDAGTTFKCMTDNLPSFCMGAVALDPKNPDIVWLGSGEQQNQRAVDFGDGVYKSTDGGKTWKNMGLTRSEHIAEIKIDPRNTDVVYVASTGPLWAPGGERGVYKTTDGGKSWSASLVISESTGISDLVMDPRNPDNLIAAAFQRRRNTGQAVGGGPEAGIFKTTNGGKTWTKMSKGLPTAWMGRIALALSPQNPDTVYAQVGAQAGQAGFYRSDDLGETWQRTAGGGGGGMFDPKKDEQKKNDPTKKDDQDKKKDDQAKKDDPTKKKDDTAKKDDPGPQKGGKGGFGGGGGSPPSPDMYYGDIFADPHREGRVFITATNLSVTNDGGKTWSGAQTKGVHVDHHAMAFDPKDKDHILLGNDGGFYQSKDNMKTWKHFPNITATQFYRVWVDNATPFYNIYGGAQDNGSQGGPHRTINSVGIRQADWRTVGGGDGFQGRSDPYDPKIIYTQSQNGAIQRKGVKGNFSRPKGGSFNWDTPFIISPHSASRLYVASNMLHRSDDRGENWKNISPNLTRQNDRNKIPIMGKFWPADTPLKNASTTPINVCNALSESPLLDGLLYVGSNDGVLAITEDGGKNWRKVDKFPDIPELATVSDVCASNHDVDTVYASFIYYEYGDFKPYLLKSTDRGRTWTSIANNLPAREFVWCILEDTVNKNLLFAGTEFGLFVSIDGGQHWTQMKGGAPTISFRDLEIQGREGDLACGTFGRGFFILDDLTPLRQSTPENLTKEGVLFTPRKTYVYEENNSLKKATMNTDLPNPAFGALITYHLGKDLPGGSKVMLTVTDSFGKKLADIEGPAKAGYNRVAWNLRPEGSQALVKPGTYRVSLNKQVAGVTTQIGGLQAFEVVPLLGQPAQDKGEEKKVDEDKKKDDIKKKLVSSR